MSDIAIRYNDSSVLENYHASTCFTILQIPECNIFSGLSKHQYREARANIIDSILHTDMSKHNEIVRELKVKIELNEISNFFSLSSREDRALLRNTIVHSGDLVFLFSFLWFYSREIRFYHFLCTKSGQLIFLRKCLIKANKKCL